MGLKMNVIVGALLAALFYYLNMSYSDQQPFRYKQYGDVKNPPLLIVPGLDGAVAFFQDVVPELTPVYNVIVYYIPLKPNNMSTANYTFEYIASDLVSVLDELEIDEISIVGESFGGIIAQYMGFLHPDRVSKLVLLSSIAKTQLPPEIEWKVKYLLPVVHAVGSVAPGLAQALFAIVHVDDVVEAHEPQYVRDIFIKEATFAHFFSVMARIQIAYHLDITIKSKFIVAPTLLVHGEDDHFTKKDTFQLKQIIPDSEVVSLPGGHLPHVTNPKEFARLVSSFC